MDWREEWVSVFGTRFKESEFVEWEVHEDGYESGRFKWASARQWQSDQDIELTEQESNPRVDLRNPWHIHWRLEHAAHKLNEISRGVKSQG